jgi:hypothetical protein
LGAGEIVADRCDDDSPEQHGIDTVDRADLPWISCRLDRVADGRAARPTNATMKAMNTGASSMPCSANSVPVIMMASPSATQVPLQNTIAGGLLMLIQKISSS